MMISENSLRMIADLFIGDIEGYYSYKPGSKLVSFFNEKFGFEHVYQSGFPSRWAYVVENLKYLWNVGQFDEFLTIILSKRYVMLDGNINEISALEKITSIIDKINDELIIEGYKLNRVGDKYTLISEDSDLEFVGEGGFANVYKIKSSGLIVKKLKDDFKQIKGVRHRFKREYDITKSLSDILGIVTVYDFNSSDYSYTMERAELTLEEFISAYDHDESSKIKMIRQILYIIKSVHERNIIHRDISPNNILIFNGQLKISDFGLGKDLDMFHSHRTMRTQSLGQYHYCAPEQFMQLKEGDKRSDVYSLGSLVNFIMNKDPRNSSHFMRNPVEKAKNENPNMRFEDAGAFLLGIEKAIRYHEDGEKMKLVEQNIQKGVYDEGIENYIYSLNGQDLCKVIIRSSKMIQIITQFISNNEKRAIELLEAVENNYSDICKTWESYDNFASISNKVIRGNFPYVAKEISARILHTIAYDINRFNAQHLIDELIDMGIDPSLEEILRR